MMYIMKFLAGELLRNLIEDYIMLKYLILHEEEHQNIWNEYQYYEIGLYKLIMTRERSTPCSCKDGHVNYRYIELLVNEYMRDAGFSNPARMKCSICLRIISKEVFEAVQIERAGRSKVVRSEDGSQRKNKKYGLKKSLNRRKN